MSCTCQNWSHWLSWKNLTGNVGSIGHAHSHKSGFLVLYTARYTASTKSGNKKMLPSQSAALAQLMVGIICGPARTKEGSCMLPLYLRYGFSIIIIRANAAIVRNVKSYATLEKGDLHMIIKKSYLIKLFDKDRRVRSYFLFLYPEILALY